MPGCAFAVDVLRFQLMMLGSRCWSFSRSDSVRAHAELVAPDLLLQRHGRSPCGPEDHDRLLRMRIRHAPAPSWPRGRPLPDLPGAERLRIPLEWAQCQFQEMSLRHHPPTTRTSAIGTPWTWTAPSMLTTSATWSNAPNRLVRGLLSRKQLPGRW